jgi:hypothetical protein
MQRNYGKNGMNSNQWPKYRKNELVQPRAYRPAKGVLPTPAPEEEEDLVVVLDDEPAVVNEDSTTEVDAALAELEALPDAALYEMVMDLPDFDPTWARTDFIERLMQ